MSDVKPWQVWEGRDNRNRPWTRIEVRNVSGDVVEFVYLDMPGADDIQRAGYTTCTRMLNEPELFRLVSSGTARSEAGARVPA